MSLKCLLDLTLKYFFISTKHMHNHRRLRHDSWLRLYIWCLVDIIICMSPLDNYIRKQQWYNTVCCL